MSETMTPLERRATFTLAAIFSARMIGLFMVLPVLALYAERLAGSTPVLLGVAIGIYGLTQALLQIPFGMLSDRLGRKPVITAGLIVFALGSAVAASADSIHGMIAGRALQGAGAIAAAVMAFAADLTREEHRTKTMAVIGMSIGLSFVVAMVAGPALNGWIGVSGIFWFITALALGAIAILHLGVPHAGPARFHRDTEPALGQFSRVMRDGQLLRLDFGVMALHLALTASFVVVPLALRDAVGLSAESHWVVYLPVMVLAMAAAVPFIVLAEKKRRMKEVLLGAVAVLALAEVGLMSFHGSLAAVGAMLWVYFTAFSLLEATLPSLLSKLAPSDAKGTAMGIYSSSQFAGAFIGGAAGGWFYGAFGLEAVFAFCASVAGAWLVLASSMRPPRHLSTYLVHVGPVEAGRASELEAAMAKVPGVAEVTIDGEGGVAYLKVESHLLDTDALDGFSVARV